MRWCIVLLDVNRFVNIITWPRSLNSRQHLLDHELSNDIPLDRTDGFYFHCPSLSVNTTSFSTFKCNKRKAPNLPIKSANSILKSWPSSHTQKHELWNVVLTPTST